MANDYQETKVITGLVRFSYTHVWEPAAVGEGSDKKYSVSLIIPKSDKRTVEAIKKAVEAAKQIGIAGKFGGKAPATLKLPLRDGDIDRPDDEAYKGAYFLNASCKTKPGIVDAKREEILDQTEFYSGCYGRASLNFYAFNTQGNKGIAAGLNNLQKLKEGEPLGGRMPAEEDFKDDFPIEGEEDFML